MKWMSRYTSQDLLYIAILSALGLAVKPIVTPLIHIISAPLMIPGGSLAGGLYMMWLVLAVAIVKKPGAGFLTALTQALVMISVGYFGNHGAVTLISYTLPGIVIDLTIIFFKRKNTIHSFVWMCTLANISGSIIVILVVMRLALIPLIISLFAASISGIIGGMLSFSIYKKLKFHKIII